MLAGGIISSLFTSFLLFFFSYLIWKKKDLSFIAGYNEKTFKGDKNKLAKTAGSFLLTMGILILFLPFLLHYFGSIAGNSITIIILIAITVFIFKLKSLNV